MKKYELALETECKTGIGVLYRIRALKDFQTVWENRIKAGDLGGWVHGEHNLSQDGKCWLFDRALATENAIVCEDATIYGNNGVAGNVKLSGAVSIGGWGIDIRGEGEISGNILIEAE